MHLHACPYCKIKERLSRVACVSQSWFGWCRQLWQLFQSMKQHFTSNSAQQPCTNVPSTSAKGPESDASSSQNSLKQGNSPTEIGVKQAAQLGKHVYDQLQKQMCGQSLNDVIKQGRDDLSTASDSQQNNDVASQAASSAPAQESSIEGADMCTNDQGASFRPKRPSSSALGASSDATTLQRPDALSHRVCPAFGRSGVHVLSLCHLLDAQPDHSCRDQKDCGVDSSSCTPRVCSLHGFCQAG